MELFLIYEQDVLLEIFTCKSAQINEFHLELEFKKIDIPFKKMIRSFYRGRLIRKPLNKFSKLIYRPYGGP